MGYTALSTSFSLLPFPFSVFISWLDHFDDNIDKPARAADDIDENVEDINVEEELVRPMSQLQSQETPRNSQQQQNSQQTDARRSVRSQGSSFVIFLIFVRNSLNL